MRRKRDCWVHKKLLLYSFFQRTVFMQTICGACFNVITNGKNKKLILNQHFMRGRVLVDWQNIFPQVRSRVEKIKATSFVLKHGKKRNFDLLFFFNIVGRVPSTNSGFNDYFNLKALGLVWDQFSQSCGSIPFLRAPRREQFVKPRRKANTKSFGKSQICPH